MKLIAILEAGFVNYTREEDGTDETQTQDDQGNTQPDQAEPDSVDQVQDDGEQQAPDDAGKPDPDRQGSIRTVPDAHLVYKRKNENNLYDELWIYKQNQHDSWTTKTYAAIVAGI